MRLFYLLTPFLLFSALYLNAQMYLNIRYPVDNQPQSKFHSITIQGERIFCIGTILDSTGYFSDHIFVLDTNGTLIHHKSLGKWIDSAFYPVFVFAKSIHIRNDTLEVFAGLGGRALVHIAYHIPSDVVQYDTLPNIQGNNENYNTNVTEWRLCKDSGYIVLYAIEYPDCALLRLDKNLKFKWHKRLHGDGSILAQTVLEDSDGGFLIGGRNALNPQDFISYIEKRDGLGNIIWRYETDTKHNGFVLDLALTPDGGIIAATQDYDQNYFAAPMLLKINAAHQKTWQKIFGEYSPELFYSSFMQQIIPDNQTNGFISVGQVYKTIPQSNDYYTVEGFLVNFTEDGDTLWTRRFRIIPDSVHLREHLLTGIHPCANGSGYWLVGSASNFSGGNWGELPREQAWMLRTDNYGCIIPGCQMVKTVELPKNKVQMLIYPNPATDYIWVYLPSLSSTDEFLIQVFDQTGKLVCMIPHTGGEITLMIQSGLWPAGRYVLQLSDKTGAVWSVGDVVKK